MLWHSYLSRAHARVLLHDNLLRAGLVCPHAPLTILSSAAPVSAGARRRPFCCASAQGSMAPAYTPTHGPFLKHAFAKSVDKGEDAWLQQRDLPCADGALPRRTAYLVLLCLVRVSHCSVAPPPVREQSAPQARVPPSVDCCVIGSDITPLLRGWRVSQAAQPPSCPCLLQITHCCPVPPLGCLQVPTWAAPNFRAGGYRLLKAASREC